MITVIVPAHNESAVIRRNLDALIEGARPGELDVIVACNGCTDDTAAVARRVGSPVRVLEIPAASKIAALNAAEAVATSFPRVYMDADVRLTIAGVRALAAALNADSRAYLSAPKLRMNLSESHWAVRAFYNVWTRLPYNQTMVGTGVYALSREGRERFGPFPDIISDDGFVRFHFQPFERIRVEAAEVWVEPPRSLAGLIRIKTRSRLGGFQLRRRFPERAIAEPKPAGGMLVWLLRHPSLWPSLPGYLYVTIMTRLKARGNLAALDRYRWQRDESRESAPASP